MTHSLTVIKVYNKWMIINIMHERIYPSKEWFTGYWQNINTDEMCDVINVYMEYV